MGYLLFAVILAATLITIISLKNRPSKDPARSVDSFRRARRALDPRRKPRRGAKTGTR